METKIATSDSDCATQVKSSSKGWFWARRITIILASGMMVALVIGMSHQFVFSSLAKHSATATDSMLQAYDGFDYPVDDNWVDDKFSWEEVVGEFPGAWPSGLGGGGYTVTARHGRTAYKNAQILCGQNPACSAVSCRHSSLFGKVWQCTLRSTTNFVRNPDWKSWKKIPKSGYVPQNSWKLYRMTYLLGYSGGYQGSGSVFKFTPKSRSWCQNNNQCYGLTCKTVENCYGNWCSDRVKEKMCTMRRQGPMRLNPPGADEVTYRLEVG